MELMNYSPFIYAYQQENIAITGKGTLDGNADNEHWWPWKGREEYGWKQGEPNRDEDRNRLTQQVSDGVPVSERIYGDGHYLRPNFIQPYDCENVLIEGVTIKRSPMWEVHPVLSTSVIVRGLTIESHGPNNDGCNPESSKNVLIEDCYFNTSDDCIAIKSGRNADGRRIGIPSENIVIRNCRMKDGHGGVVMGSEMSGGVRNVFAEDCIMDSPNLDRVLRIKTNSVRGGYVRNVFMRNIKVGEVNEAILKVNFQYEGGDVGDFTPVVQNINLTNVTSQKSEYALLLRGYKRSPITGITLKNCKFKGVSKGNVLENAKDIEFTDVYINGKLQKSP